MSGQVFLINHKGGVETVIPPGGIDLRCLGGRMKVERVGSIEFNEAKQSFGVESSRFQAPGRFDTYDAARDAEHAAASAELAAGRTLKR